MEFEYKTPLFFLGIVPFIVWGMYLAYLFKDKSLLKFASEDMIKKIKPATNWNLRAWKMIWFSLTIIFLLLALAKPKAGIDFEEVESRGRDLVILLDLSKSMLAEDVRPSRLERAKKDIEDLIDVLGGDRIALIAFAGRVEVRCPLTLDYNFFKWALDECHPGVVALGGTSIGDAIREAIKLFDSEKKDTSSLERWLYSDEDVNIENKAILLITDGEDHETAPLEAAALARKNNITIFTVGFGDDKEGARIPITNREGRKEYLKNSKGEIVWSRLNEKLLMEISLTTKNGIYFPAKTRNINMASVYQDYISKIEVKLQESAQKPKGKEVFQIFLLLACICFIVENFLMEGTMKKHFAVVLISLLLWGCSSENNEAWRLNHEGNKKYDEGQIGEAREKYQEAEVLLPENSLLTYNVGNTFYQQKNWEEARKYYQKAILNTDNASYDKDNILFLTAFNEGCTYYREAEILMPRASDQKQILEVIQLLQKSLEHFRRALGYRQEDQKTLHNLRFVKLFLKNFLDMLHKKEQQEKEKNENSIALLAQIRQLQFVLTKQAHAFILENNKDKLLDLVFPQREIAKLLQKFEKKLEQDFNQAKQQLVASGQNNPQGTDRTEQMKTMLEFAKKSIADALEFATVSGDKLEKNDVSSIVDQEKIITTLDPIWQILATYDILIQEDILLQAFVVHDVSVAKKDILEEEWQIMEKQQNRATQTTNDFIQKFDMSQSMKHSISSPEQNSAEPKIDEEKIRELSQQALKEQENTVDFIASKERDETQEWAEKALETLKKIAAELGSNNSNQNQNQEDQNKKDEDQKQEPQKDEKDENNKDNESKEKDISDDQQKRMLQKVKERMQKNKKDKEENGYSYSGGVENDW